MELLRRALLIGSLLPGLWLFRLAPLDPLVSLVPVDFGARQARERAALDDRASEAQRRQAELPLSVYIEELLQYNVFSAVGPDWERLLAEVDARTGPDARPVFLRADVEPMVDAGDRLAAGGGTTFISLSRPGGDVHYQVVRHVWTRRDFDAPAGFRGASPPPPGLLYPFRLAGLAAVAAGLLFFFLLPARPAAGARSRRPAIDSAALGAGLAAFALPLVMVGGSIQALTRAPWLTSAAWLAAFVCLHRFAAPARHAPDPPVASSPASRMLFIREGLVFLVMAFGPVVFLASMSLLLWDR